MKNFIYLLVFISLLSCKIADISIQNNTSSQQTKDPKNLLRGVIKAQGFDNLQDSNVYSITLEDHWPGFIGGIAKLWYERKTVLDVKLNYGTFDQKIQFLSAKHSGKTVGLQSWKYYWPKQDGFHVKEKLNAREQKLRFGMVVIHYFMELPIRLYNAPILKYYGHTAINGEKYELVFASWQSERANKEFDQYIIYINQRTKLVDFCLYTLRDIKNPFTRGKYGSIAFRNYKEINGFKYATEMPVFLDDGVLKTTDFKNYFHKFNINEIELGGFDEKELYPIQGIKKLGDVK